MAHIRQMHEMTQADIAASVGASQQSWSEYELDKVTPSERILWAFCGVYHVSHNWLTTGEGSAFTDGYWPGDPLGEPIDVRAFERERLRKLMMGEGPMELPRRRRKRVVLTLTDQETALLRKLLEGEPLLPGDQETAAGLREKLP